MSREARVLAQAKINVWLHVGPVYDGRFHLLSTLFHRIDLADLVAVRAEDTRRESLDVTGPTLPPAGLGPSGDNLAVRAARAFRERTGWPRGWSITIEKRIPVGGGLGGGSADAAAVLRALNALAPAPLAPDALQHVAVSVGSDVPFLVSEMVSALGSGRGERLTPMPAGLPASPVVLVLPSFGVATADAYRWLDERGTRKGVDLTPPTVDMGDPWGSVDLGNDFEPVVEARQPFIALARRRLRECGAALARMSGSGSTVFGVFPDGAPTAAQLALDATIIHTRVSENVVAVEVRE